MRHSAQASQAPHASLQALHRPATSAQLPHQLLGARPMTAPPLYPLTTLPHDLTTSAPHHPPLSYGGLYLPTGPHPLHNPAAPAAGLPPWAWNPWQVGMGYPLAPQPTSAATHSSPVGSAAQPHHTLSPNLQGGMRRDADVLQDPQTQRRSSTAINFTAQHPGGPTPDRPSANGLRDAAAVDGENDSKVANGAAESSGPPGGSC